jgi:UDP-N-acetylglucosamine--N-acetylmuramyl-(pentapeptide) pyrophosphoryl-undecaprenol N-acetylglucosamine transferase
MKILICGGHLTPALAVIDNLPNDAHVLYVGRKHALEGDSAVSLEYHTVSERKIPFVTLQTGRLQRKWTKHTIPSLLKLPKGFFHAFSIIKKYKPDVIVGFGGYISVPLCIAGWMQKIPVIIHEQTLEVGLANKILSPFATKICISWKNSEKFFPKHKTSLTGNPAISVIADFIKTCHPELDSGSSLYKIPKQVRHDNIGNRPILVIVGGSLGSHAINILVEGCLEKLLQSFTIIHQTGAAKAYNDYDRLLERKETLPYALRKFYTLSQFIEPEKIITTFQKADLIISRAGINTVTTLLILNKPTLFIPLPVSQNQEQLKNAQFFADHGLGEVIEQSSLTSETMLSLVTAMLKNKKHYTNTKDLHELTIHKTAAKNIIEIITSLA